MIPRAQKPTFPQVVANVTATVEANRQQQRQHQQPWAPELELQHLATSATQAAEEIAQGHPA
jgi:hypothetical protein